MNEIGYFGILDVYTITIIINYCDGIFNVDNLRRSCKLFRELIPIPNIKTLPTIAKFADIPTRRIYYSFNGRIDRPQFITNLVMVKDDLVTITDEFRSFRYNIFYRNHDYDGLILCGIARNKDHRLLEQFLGKIEKPTHQMIRYALYISVANNDIETIKKICGCYNINATNKDGDCDGDEFDTICHMLVFGVVFGSLPICEYALEIGGNNVDTALKNACMFGQVNILEYLMNFQYSPDIEYELVKFAAKYNQTHVKSVLIKKFELLPDKIDEIWSKNHTSVVAHKEELIWKCKCGYYPSGFDYLITRIDEDLLYDEFDDENIKYNNTYKDKVRELIERNIITYGQRNIRECIGDSEYDGKEDYTIFDDCPYDNPPDISCVSVDLIKDQFNKKRF